MTADNQHHSSCGLCAPAKTRFSAPHHRRFSAIMFSILVCCALVGGSLRQSRAQEQLSYPRIINIQYDAIDPKQGGHFLLWVEREKIFYGLDPRLYPAAQSVKVTHITPGPGSSTVTTIAVTKIDSSIPDYFHLSGNVRFKITGMRVSSSNVPGENR